VDFSSAARELYGVPPGEFTTTRKRLVQEAKSSGDAALAKRIGALRRPTVPAFAVNLLSRSAEDELGELLDVGTGLREAWSSGGGIGGLEQRRGELVASLVRRARELAEDAGQPLREPAVREVEDTLQAATVDADVAEEVREGRLTQPRSHTGFVPAGFPVSLDRSEAPSPQEVPRPEEPEEEKPPAPRRTGAQEKAVQAARRRAEKADRDLAERAAEYAEARDDLRTADAEVGRLRRELDKVRRQLDRAEADQESSAKRLEKAESRRDRAAEAAEEARRKAGDAADAI
jgi:hypothetical protein